MKEHINKIGERLELASGGSIKVKLLEPQDVGGLQAILEAVSSGKVDAGYGSAGFWAGKIVTGVPAAVPLVGEPLVLVLRGGESVGQSTLTRFYSAHTFVLPLAAAVLMLTHFLMIRKQGISGPL